MAGLEAGRQAFGPKLAPDQGGGAGGGTPQPPDANATIRQIADQSASQAIGRHEQTKPHLGDGDVRRVANEQHDAATHPGLAHQTDVDALSTQVGQVDQRVGTVEQRVEQLEQHPQQPPAPQVTSQAVADAVRQDPVPFVTAIRPHLPAGGGTGLSEADVRTFAADEVTKAAAGQRADGWVGAAEVEQTIQDAIDDGTLANGADVPALQTRLTGIENRLPAGNEALITATEADTRIETARQALEGQITAVQGSIPANIVTADVLNRRLPPPTLGQRALAVFGDRRARQYVNDYDANAPAPAIAAPATPAAPPAPTPITVDRRTLIGVGAVLAGAGVCAWLGLPAVADFLRRLSGTGTEYPPPSGGTSGGNIPPAEYTPSGLDYSNMSPQQAEQIIKYIDANYSHSDGPTVSVDIPDGQVGIVTGWQVSYGGNTYVKGDTAAFTGQANVSFSDGRWRVVPSTVAKDAFVALVVYTKALNEDMSHAQPLSSWGLPAFG